MNILYLSAMFDDEILDVYYDKGKTPNYAANKYHQLLSLGLAENGISVNAYATLPISRANSSKKIVRWRKTTDGKLTKQYISCINFPGVKHFMLASKAFFKTLFSAKNTVVIYDVLVISSSFGALLASKLRGMKSVGIVTDLPMYVNSSPKCNRINHRLISMADGYVFLTKQMNEVINPQGKPYVVLEGHADVRMSDVTRPRPKAGKRVVMYAGALYRKYGVANLVESFLKIAKENEELHLYGNGGYAAELREITKLHPQVIYHGCFPNQQVVQAELTATLLVNPRTSEGEYTKYSFPSKTMEYMVSGTPVLCAKLPGFPDEYDEYLYYFDDAQEDGLAVALRQALDRDSRELEAFGQKARSFVLAEKNHVAQAGRIIQFIKNSWSIS
ncbi:MAG: glycosyltransferase family 4 protein [Ruminococcaceae bacterium]|nr:glycosyltransferase family 4 protein [Oscillospiraceae bacterium]